MAKFTYYCQDCGTGPLSTDYQRKTPYVCRYCANDRYSANQKKHSKDGPLKKKLIKERGSRCEQCGLECKVMMHHIIEVKDGGETTPENCILLCQDHHKEAHGGRGVGSAEYWYDKRYP